MDCNEKSDREVLKGIIAMLFSFAVMAEGVADRSYFMRCYMLWILRRAEASALRCVGLDVTFQAWALHRNSRADALNLAGTLREVAHWLEGELREDDLFAVWWARSDGLESEEWQRFAAKVFPPPLRATPLSRCRLGRFLFQLQACRVVPPP